MSDESAFLAAIAAEPDEDTPRLAYADWLQEHGQDARAEFIREAIEFDKWYDEHEPAPGAVEARKRLAGLLSEWFPGAWPIPPCPRAFPEGQYSFLKDSVGVVVHGDTEKPGHRAVFNRGFVTQLICTAADWLRHADAILASHPLRRVNWTAFTGEAAAELDRRYRAKFGRKLVEKFLQEIAEEMWPGVSFTFRGEPTCPLRLSTSPGAPTGSALGVPSSLTESA